MRYILLLSTLCSGIYYEYQSCILSIVLVCLLWREVKKNEMFIWKKNYLAFFFPELPLFYLVSAIWAVDSQMALLGFLKYLPIGICSLIMMQAPRVQQEMLDALPKVSVGMVLLSAVGGMIPELSKYVVVNGRLAGTFQYPNTFALFLLVALLYLLYQRPFNKMCVLQVVILIAGILAAGSRTVYLLLPVSLLIFGFFAKKKTVRKVILGTLAILFIVVGVILLVTQGGPLERILEISLSESTLLGRVLYWKDALPVIAKNPLGLGYLGYYFTQGGFQTGVYSVIHAHNEFVQIFLDLGWVAGIGFIAAILYGITKSDVRWKSILIGIMAVHAFVDFDLQYMAVYMVLLSLFPWERGGEWTLSRSKLFSIVAVFLVIISAYGGFGNAAYYFGQQKIALAFLPKNTLLLIECLKQTENLEEMEQIADGILQQNEAVAIAWDAKARNAFLQGDVLAMMEYKEMAISLSKYEISEYTDYLDMLFVAIQMYEAAGDVDSAKYCAEKALTVPIRLQEVKAVTSSLGWRIADKPELELPDEYKTTINLLN